MHPKIVLTARGKKILTLQYSRRFGKTLCHFAPKKVHKPIANRLEFQLEKAEVNESRQIFF